MVRDGVDQRSLLLLLHLFLLLLACDNGGTGRGTGCWAWTSYPNPSTTTRSTKSKSTALFSITSEMLTRAPPSLNLTITTAHQRQEPLNNHHSKPIGTSFLSQAALEKIDSKKSNPIEKLKRVKDGTAAFTDIYAFAQHIRQGTLKWEDIERHDLDSRLKWAGLLHRSKRTPGQFLMRLRVPNGILSSAHLRAYADIVEPYGPDMGVVDITTRQNIQLRGIRLDHADQILNRLHQELNQTSFQSALDNVRNVVGSPLAGIDLDDDDNYDNELVDTRPLCDAVDRLCSVDPVTHTFGNPVWGNLPRKFNIAISGSRGDFAHTHINDIGLQPVPHATLFEQPDGNNHDASTKQKRMMGFNVVVGGYMSIKRVAEAVPLNVWIPADETSVVALCEAILRLFRDEGDRGDRQKARLMWLVEKMGVHAFRQAVMDEVQSYQRGVYMDEAQSQPEASQPQQVPVFQRRELLGIHPQHDSHSGKVRVGIHVPTGRLSVQECRQLADLADTYSHGEIRLTVEQNVLLPNVDTHQVEALLKEPALVDSRLQVHPGNIEGHVVSCTGAQFCGLALIETKQRAESLGTKLEALVHVDRPIRIHWTGCPNSCGQVQAADIGIMGAPAKKMVNGKNMAVPGCKIFVGGRIGEDAHLSVDPYLEGIPVDDDDLLPVLVYILKNQFGAVDRIQPKQQ